MSSPKYRFNVWPVPCGSDKAAVKQFVWGRRGEALLVSEPHHRLKNGYWSGGGPFCTVRTLVEHDAYMPAYGVVRNGVDFGRYSIAGVDPFASTVKPTNPFAGMRASATILNECAANYATGYARAKPGNPVASLGQFLYELKELPTLPLAGLTSFNPSETLTRYLQGDKLKDLKLPKGTPLGIPGRKPKFTSQLVDKNFNPAISALGTLSYFKALGHEYLNVVFGWEPFVRDLQGIYLLWKDIDKHLAQIIRENGRGIRRKATIAKNRTQTVSNTFFPLPWIHCGGNPGTIAPGSTLYTVTTTTTERAWFVGRFQYYIPDIGTSQWTARAREALFGTKPTPSLLWNVLPWTWLIDWFSNVGDTVSNLNSGWAENLVSKYTFVMRRTDTETVAEAKVRMQESLTAQNSWARVDFPLRSRSGTTEKARVGGGNPFGLNVQLPSLSAKQLGILAALGISRGLVK